MRLAFYNKLYHKIHENKIPCLFSPSVRKSRKGQQMYLTIYNQITNIGIFSLIILESIFLYLYFQTLLKNLMKYRSVWNADLFNVIKELGWPGKMWLCRKFLIKIPGIELMGGGTRAGGACLGPPRHLPGGPCPAPISSILEIFIKNILHSHIFPGHSSSLMTLNS